MTNSALNSLSPYSNFLQVKNTVQPSSATIPPMPIASVTLSEEQKEEKSNAFTKTVAGVAIFGAICGIFLAKGASSTFYKKLNSYMQKLDDKIYEYTNSGRKLGFLKRISLNFNKGLRKTLDYLKISNNITAVKDSAFGWFCAKTGLKTPMDWVTKQFKKITILTVRHSYENARNITDANIAKLRSIIDTMSENTTNSSPEATKLKELKRLLNLLEKQIQNITTATTRTERLKEIETATSDVGKKVSSELATIMKSPTRENMQKLRLYRTEVHSAEGKNNLVKKLRQSERGFTFNIQDKTRIMSDASDEIGRIVKFEDNNSRNALRKLSQQIKEYSNLSGNKEVEDRKKLVEKMQNTVTTLKENFAKGKYSEQSSKLFETQISEIETILQNNETKGTIEEILILLNNLGLKESNPAMFSRAKSLTNQIRNAANKAFENELKLYDKFAEYSVGSAPTDVLGMLIPIGLGAYAISKGDNKDEKVSATLKAGIPIIGGIGTTFIAAAKLMTNVQGLILGALTGLVLNALGSKADEAYKQYQEDNMFAQKAIAEYQKRLRPETKA